MDKKAKKKALLKKNRQNQEIFQAMRLREREAERVEDLEEDLRPRRRAEKSDEPVWSAKVGEIRSRLTGRKRDAKERWNRFSGTGDEGARGL